MRIYGPLGSRQFLQMLAGLAGGIDYSVDIQELDDGAAVEAEGFRVIAARVEHVGMCLAFRVEEDERRGSVDLERAAAAGIAPGPLLGRLLDQGSVEVGGRTIRKEDVIGPAKPGRSVVFSGDTRPCAGLTRLSRGADLLIHESTYLHELQSEAVARAHSTAVEAAGTAVEAGVRRLALTHVSPRHQDTPAPLLREASALFPGSFLPNDLDELEIPLLP